MELNNLKQSGEINVKIDPDKGGSKKVFFVIFALVILFIIFALVYGANRSAKNQEKLAQDMDLSFLNVTTTSGGLTTAQTLEKSASVSGTSAVTKTVTAKTTKTTATSLSAAPTYLKTLNVYRTSGYYFQFVNCSGSPGSLLMKKGVKFMMDNRDKKAHKFVVMGKTYLLGAYGYTIVTADKIGKHFITCDGGGAAQITVVQ